MDKKIVIITLFTNLFISVYGVNNFVRIAGIFDTDSEEEEATFRHAVEQVNKERTPITLVGETFRVVPKDDFLAQQTICSCLWNGVVGIIGPGSEHIRSLCDSKEIPQVETRSNPFQNRGLSNVNLHPHPPILARAYADLIRAFGWKNPVILYENDESFPRINEILKIGKEEAHVRLMQLDERGIGDFRPALLGLKRSKWTEVIIDCSLKSLPLVLEQALQVGIMADEYSYFITNLDLYTLDMFPYSHGGANLTGVRLVDTENPATGKTLRALNQEGGLRTELALIHDAVRLMAKALRHAGIFHLTEEPNVSCNSTESWKHGSSVLNYLRTRSLSGLSGSIVFDHQGFRTDFSLAVLELSLNGLQTAGSWNTSEGLNMSRGQVGFEGEQSLQNKSFVVLIALSDPYNMLKEASQKLSGNDRFEGYGIDLIHELSLMLGFNYTFRLQEDGQYGTQDLKTKKWSGMILELLEHRADLAITDLTITSERESAVDFTMPFMNLGISILYKKPMKLPPSLFTFLSPFSEAVWRYLGGAYLGVSLALYVLARISPAEWTNRYPCQDEPEFLENQFSFRNSLWFTVGSLMQQGSEIAPIAISTRMVAGLWWFFTLIMVSTYTANLAACLTVESLSSPFKNIEDLVSKKDVIKFGAKNGGSTANFFRDSIHPAHQKIWENMQKHPEDMTDSNLDGVLRAENENYAFFMESTTIEYTVQRHCNLNQVGRLLDDKGYGIAMRKNSPYRNTLSAAVIKLQETGRLSTLKRKWWKEKRGGGACHSDIGTGEAQELDLANVGGVFFVLVVGSVGGFLVGIVEFLFQTLKLSYQNKTTFRQQLKNEIGFLLDFRKRTKKTNYKSQEPKRDSQENDYQQPYRYIPEFGNKNFSPDSRR